MPIIHVINVFVVTVLSYKRVIERAQLFAYFIVATTALRYCSIRHRRRTAAVAAPVFAAVAK